MSDVVWVDPPSGWKYGFPKMWDCKGEMYDWLVSEGYPESEIQAYGEYFFIRSWDADEEERKLFYGKS